MKLRKIMAAVLAASLVLGNGVASLADSISGQGVVNRIKDREGVSKVVLPASQMTQSDGIMNFTVDPEGLIAASHEIFTVKKGTTASGGVTPVGSDGVYFVHSDGTIKSTSDPLKLIVKAQEDQDIFVTAAASGGTIELVDSSGTLNSSGVAKLYLEVKLGSDGTAKAITDSTGVTLNAQVDGKPDNFKISAVTGSQGVYEVTESGGVAETSWDYAELTLSGKSQGIVPAGGLTSPEITFTWEVKKHYTEKTGLGNWSGTDLWMAIDEETGFPTNGSKVEVSKDGKKYVGMPASTYSINDAGWISTTWDDIVDVVDDEAPEHLYVSVVCGNDRYVCSSY